MGSNTKKNIVLEVERDRSYDIYEENDSFFYKYNGPNVYNDKYTELGVDISLTDAEKAWLKAPSPISEVGEDPALRAGLLSKIIEDRDNKFSITRQKIYDSHKKMEEKRRAENLRTDTSVKSDATETSEESYVAVESPQIRRYHDVDERSDDSLESGRTETSAGSLFLDIPELLSSDSSTADFYTANDSYHEDDTQSVFSDLTDDFDHEDPFAVDESTVDPADGAVPVLSSDDTHKQAIYDELQAIATILAGLKGNEPRLERVRTALQGAMEETGIKGMQTNVPEPEPTVVTPPADLGTGPASELEPEDDNLTQAEKIEKNIEVLTEVQGKLQALMLNHRAILLNDESLKQIFTELDVAVKESLEASHLMLAGQNLKDAHQSAMPQVPTTPLTNLGSENKEEPDNDDDTVSTLGSGPG